MEKFTLFFSINKQECLDRETEIVLDRAVGADSHIIYLTRGAVYQKGLLSKIMTVFRRADLTLQGWLCKPLLLRGGLLALTGWQV